MLHAKTKFLGLVCVAMVQAGCGGDSSSGSTPVVVVPPPVVKNASPGGIWLGTDSTGAPVEGIVTETGKFEFVKGTGDNAQYVGTGVTTGTAFSGNLDGYAAYTQTFPDGSVHGTGTVSGTVSERKTLNVTITFKTDAGNSTTSDISMTFNARYSVPSSLATVAGNYTVSGSHASLSISASGVVFAQDPSSGCVSNGSIAAIDPTYNAYLITFDYANCTGDATVLNGTTVIGMGELNNTVVPSQILFGVSGATTSGGTAAIVKILTHT